MQYFPRNEERVAWETDQKSQTRHIPRAVKLPSLSLSSKSTLWWQLSRSSFMEFDWNSQCTLTHCVRNCSTTYSQCCKWNSMRWTNLNFIHSLQLNTCECFILLPRIRTSVGGKHYVVLYSIHKPFMYMQCMPIISIYSAWMCIHGVVCTYHYVLANWLVWHTSINRLMYRYLIHSSSTFLLLLPCGFMKSSMKVRMGHINCYLTRQLQEPTKVNRHFKVQAFQTRPPSDRCSPNHKLF